MPAGPRPPSILGGIDPTLSLLLCPPVGLKAGCPPCPAMAVPDRTRPPALGQRGWSPAGSVNKAGCPRPDSPEEGTGPCHCPPHFQNVPLRVCLRCSLPQATQTQRHRGGRGESSCWGAKLTSKAVALGGGTRERTGWGGVCPLGCFPPHGLELAVTVPKCHLSSGQPLAQALLLGGEPPPFLCPLLRGRVLLKS